MHLPTLVSDAIQRILAAIADDVRMDVLGRPMDLCWSNLGRWILSTFRYNPCNSHHLCGLYRNIHFLVILFFLGQTRRKYRRSWNLKDKDKILNIALSVHSFHMQRESKG